MVAANRFKIIMGNIQKQILVAWYQRLFL